MTIKDMMLVNSKQRFIANVCQMVSLAMGIYFSFFVDKDGCRLTTIVLDLATQLLAGRESWVKHNMAVRFFHVVFGHPLNRWVSLCLFPKSLATNYLQFCPEILYFFARLHNELIFIPLSHTILTWNILSDGSI